MYLLQDNPTLRNKEKGELLFPTGKKLRQLTLMVESRGDSLITTESFEEMRREVVGRRAEVSQAR